MTDRRMSAAPSCFSGTLDEFLGHVVPNLPSASIVEYYHHLLLDYCSAPEPLFLIRSLPGTERRNIYRTTRGNRFKATDNAPAWWMHRTAFHERRIAPSEFASALSKVPAHMFDIEPGTGSINTAGWHVAHIFPVKDGDTAYQRWSKQELTRRFIRNIHPCNYFFIALPEWQKWGGDERIIGFFAARYAERYGTVWSEFLHIAGADMSTIARVTGPTRYEYGLPGETAIPSQLAVEQRAAGAQGTAPGGRGVVSYRASRLLFRADTIEPLTPEQRFRVITPVGTFEMTKADFYRAFPNVVRSQSYREAGVYHYPKVPRAALEFQI